MGKRGFGQIYPPTWRPVKLRLPPRFAAWMDKQARKERTTPSLWLIKQFAEPGEEARGPYRVPGGEEGE